MKKKAKDLFIGAHTSIAGGVHNALLEGQKIGATTVQLFTANQKQWASRLIDEEKIALWKEAALTTGINHVMSHDSYLINLGAPDADILIKSREAFRKEADRCLQLGIDYLNFHPGASKNEDVQLCLDRICESLMELEEPLKLGHTRLLLETTAGQGSTVGHRFEQVAYIINKVEKHIRIGVCIDTCHIFAAGYDIRTPEAFDKTLVEFDNVIGLKHLYAFHVNDSMKPFNSRVDRHADLGKGEIGIESFKFLMQDSRTREIPKYLETPGGLEVWEKDIAMLREFAE
jgi:deoxyribonuclease-4